MKTSIIGYPRIGAMRELKFACERYFKGESDAAALEATAKELRLRHLAVENGSGLDFIPSGDFSFYDNMLDTAVLLNAVPRRYRELGLGALDTYFAMARGYQGEKGDVKALAMKKWFNTNYHYMVPEIEDDARIRLAGTRPLELFAEALRAGVQTRPVVIGPFTFLKLARYTGSKTAADHAPAVIAAYRTLLEDLSAAGAEWVQLDEPSLVTDLGSSDIAFFRSVYTELLSCRRPKVLLETYFGDVRDCYTDICALPFEGVGLDFVEGSRSLSLVKAFGFPAGKLLFAGVVNGKNIWKNDYAATCRIMQDLARAGAETVLSTSCSLLHVPYTVKAEPDLPEECRARFAFAEEKIAECIRIQEEIGLDVLVHGEFERNDMVEYFGENLEGYVFTRFAWVQSYGTRCVKPPVIWGDISRARPMTVKWSTYAQSLTDKPVKGMLTGPVTILNWSFPREDITLRESAMQLALAIRDEVLDLEANGISVIQVDEAALREKLPLRKADRYSAYLDWAIPAFRLVHSGVRPETQVHTHMCYSEFGDIIRDIDNMDADVITFEASRSDLRILDDLVAADFRTEVGPGVYDIHSPRVPSKEEIAAALRKMLAKIPASKLWVNPDCGLKTRGWKETVPSLTNLVAAAKEVRDENK